MINLGESDLQKWGLQGIMLRTYQLDGVRWLVQCLKNQEGCILGDEMGLGKTCQTISLLVYMSGALGIKGPFLVLSPLSVMDNWRTEMKRFSPGLTVLSYTGDKDTRAELQRNMDTMDFQVLLTTYELCLKDATFLKKRNWKILVVDEAHRLKNQNSLLHKTLTEFSVGFRVLLTGTPIQNNLLEVYSLLNFIQPSLFTADEKDNFVDTYAHVQSQPTLASDLQSILQPFLLRRVKAEVAADLPRKTELVVYHGMSALQKKYYKALLMKDREAFGREEAGKTRLLNILMQLRKCVDHPYLFDGVEPEPFVMGEHLVEASGKLCLLDSMLSYLHEGGHRVLLFSQLTRMLDIVQDYMEYRGYSYERLDGSVRGEERNLAIKNFSSKDVFVFLLSTRAGGVGMNLTAADTVIFMDSDFNPQNDLQAAARCHRIGQTRAVKVIRLLGRDTVEEIVYSRAVSKLRLTNTVIEEGRFSLLEKAQSAAAGLQLSEVLKFGVDKLLSSEESTVQEVDLSLILGPSRGGEWLSNDDLPRVEEEDSEPDSQNHMYCFEGRDYSRDPSSEDRRSFEQLLEEQLEGQEEAGGEGRALRHKAGGALAGPLGLAPRKRKVLSEAELEARRKRGQEAAAKRAKLLEDRKRNQQEQKQKKKMAWWDSCGYRSRCLPLVESEEEDEDGSICSTDSEHAAIRYVLGDVTHPHAAGGDAIIVHCVDDSGRWGRGGLFSALEVRSDEPRKQYELAGKMKDLELGRVLLFPIDDRQSRLDGQDHLALAVTQHRDQANKLSGILLPSLEESLRAISLVARRKKASVHLPRIGHSTVGFNWYGTERLIRKHLSSQGVPTSIYYYSRTASAKATAAAVPGTSTGGALSPARSPGSDGPSAGEEEECEGGPGGSSLPDFMKGVHVFFYNLAASERKRLARYLLSYDGEEEEVMSSEVTHIVAEVESPIHSQRHNDAAHSTKHHHSSKKVQPTPSNTPPHIQVDFRSLPPMPICLLGSCQSVSTNTPEEDDETMSKACEKDAVPDPASSPHPCRQSPSDHHASFLGYSTFRRQGHMRDQDAHPQRHAGNHARPLPSFGLYQPPLGLPAGYSQPTPFPSGAEGSWLHPSYASGWSGPGAYPSSLPSCLVPGDYHSYPLQSPYSSSKSISLPGRYSPSMGSLEQPGSLHSNPPSADMHQHTLPSYYCSPQGAACCAQCPVDLFKMGPVPHQGPRLGYRPPYDPLCSDTCRPPIGGHMHSSRVHPNVPKAQLGSTALSLEQRRVFVTYEADNEKHVNDVINFVGLLRHNGFDTHIDMFEQQFRSISKIDFMERYLSEKEYLIIIVISPKYYETVTAAPVSLQHDEQTLATVYIHKQLQNEFIQNGSKNFRFIPIVFPGAQKCHVPTWLQNTHVYSWPRDRDDILRRLMRVEKYNPPPIGELPTIISIPI
ncbi:chromodomain-helicase-DNA-binding protein 1-like isoform X3 [Osmerus mordax]|uniref:chromodomain-helicase-DNA-binding protein 1-like isoform X3 n=1 Tax=Osmerus mordax TaxID=8014 RepID=UPI003510A16E